MRTAECTPGDLLHLLLKTLPEKKALADLELVQTPEERRLPLLTDSDGGA